MELKRTLIVGRTCGDAERLRKLFPIEFVDVGNYGDARTGVAYDNIIVGMPWGILQAEEQEWVDEVLKPSVNPGGQIIYL